MKYKNSKALRNGLLKLKVLVYQSPCVFDAIGGADKVIATQGTML